MTSDLCCNTEILVSYKPGSGQAFGHRTGRDERECSRADPAIHPAAGNALRTRSSRSAQHDIGTAFVISLIHVSTPHASSWLVIFPRQIRLASRSCRSCSDAKHAKAKEQPCALLVALRPTARLERREPARLALCVSGEQVWDRPPSLAWLGRDDVMLGGAALE